MSKSAVLEKQVYMNRELSWLKFNERVLEEAESENVLHSDLPVLANQLSYDTIRGLNS